MPQNEIVVTAGRVKQEICGFLNGPHGGGTLQLGAAATGVLAGAGGAAGAGIAFDRSGNIAGYDYVGFGPGAGLSGDVGSSVQVNSFANGVEIVGKDAREECYFFCLWLLAACIVDMTINCRKMWTRMSSA